METQNWQSVWEFNWFPVLGSLHNHEQQVLKRHKWMKCGNHSMWMEMLGKETLGLRNTAWQVRAKAMQSVSSASAS